MKQINIEQVIFTYEKKIRLFFLKNTYNRNDVDDLVQETLCRVIASVHTFSGKSHISTWIYSICKNVLFGYIYQKDKQKRIIQKINQRKHNSLQDFQSNLELRFLIDSLSGRDKVLFNLYYVKKYSIKEISKLMNKPSGTVKYYLYQLRNTIKKYGKK